MQINEKLIKEHQEIEQELIELEVIMAEEVLNYSNLIHVLKKLIFLWDIHEKAEEEYFNKLKKINYAIPYRQILFEHGRLKIYREYIFSSLNSESEFKLKKCLILYGKKMIFLLRRHIKMEDEILYLIPQGIFS